MAIRSKFEQTVNQDNEIPLEETNDLKTLEIKAKQMNSEPHDYLIVPTRSSGSNPFMKADTGENKKSDAVIFDIETVRKSSESGSKENLNNYW